MGSEDAPAPPSYYQSEQDALRSYLDTNPAYFQTAVKQQLGSSYYGKAGEVERQQYNSVQRDVERINQALGSRKEKLRMGQYATPAEAKQAQAEVDAMNAELVARQGELRKLEKDFDIRPVEGLGQIDVAKAYGDAALDLGDEAARRQLALRKELGVKNVLQSREELKAADPVAFAAREKLQRQMLGEAGDINAGTQGLAGISADALAAYKAGPNKDLVTLQDRTRANMTALDTGALAKMRADFLKEYELGSTLDDSTRTEVEQQARAGQAARGNILGNAAAYSEAMQVGREGEARKQQRAANLAGIETQYAAQDAQNMGLFGTATGAVIGDRDRLTNNATAADNNLFGRKQQNLANAQSVLLGNPLSAQFGTLGAAGTGAVNYQPGIGGQSAAAANGNAGSQYALGAYNANTQANASAGSNPWLNVATGVVGAGVGAFTGGLGGGLASSMFSQAAGGGAGPTHPPSGTW